MTRHLLGATIVVVAGLGTIGGCRLANETRSLVVSSNWEFEQWTNFLPDVTAASAILDRILHHCEVVILNGDSYRLRQAKGMVRPKS